ncbi:ankyrin repeat domain-containing protein [Streptomyces litchfieldiae]|uniref:Ankyrin repeat domain-containing protein n=1 Tax=Streptomyces litchfieldiae TaxID=3075543 RepID=A0ABU2MRB7_9ACTN|nr:ankyrin repeat domain-containing protein [Streptomyces sp. DSM 44938]MDT0343134.1 ankyrin repeat domain-containing protein [Streptomyces sp. DSM 44938]
MECEVPAWANHGMSPAHLAVERGQLDELTRLLDTGTDPDELWGDMTLLRHAIDVEADGATQSGKPLEASCTAVLLAYGADPELPGADGTIPRLMAFHAGHGLAVRLLEAHMARKRGSPVPDPCPTLPPAEPSSLPGAGPTR